MTKIYICMINIGNPKGTSDSYQVVRPAPCPDAGLLGGLPRPVWAKLSREFCIPSQLRSASLMFLRSVQASMAVHFGWMDLDLFGVYKDLLPLMKARLDACGLIPMMAWAPWQPVTLKSIDEDFAELVTPSGSVLRHPRVRPARHLQVVWWSNPFLIVP